MTTAAHIARTALDLFYRQGFHAAGVDLLSQAAGVTKRTLYRHFPTKDALIAAALDLRHEQFMGGMQAFVEAASVPQRPLAYIEFIQRWAASHDFHGCAFINASAEFSQVTSAPHAQAAQHKSDVQGYVMQLCQAADVKHPELVAMQLFLLGEGLIVSSQVNGYDASIGEAALETAKAWLAKSMGRSKRT
jgi:AcrR family transcriptional regulator